MTALMSLDVKSGELTYADFEPLSALIFSTVLSPDRKHAYGVYTTLTSIDVEGHRLEKRVPLDHTFYAVNLSTTAARSSREEPSATWVSTTRPASTRRRS